MFSFSLASDEDANAAALAPLATILPDAVEVLIKKEARILVVAVLFRAFLKDATGVDAVVDPQSQFKTDWSVVVFK